VTFTTEDGVQLEADLHQSGRSGGPAVVLLHMIPPSNDKSNFTPEFIASLTGAGYTVLNVNRRGAGNSGGNAKDAYEGDKGRLDAVAAHDFLTESACAVPAGAVGFVGASNGTTTTLDFAVGAAAGDRPPVIAFLSPGPYTENQNVVADIAAIPVFFGYPDAETEWPHSVKSADTGHWTFKEYAGGKHGTGLFGTNPASIGDVTDFVEAHLTF
jgi:pimeloyl-ACP methyl ester carboxylesterase